MRRIEEVAAMTVDGPIAVPKTLRDALGADAGTRMTYELHDDGRVLVSLATVRLQQWTDAWPPGDAAQALRRLPVGASHRCGRQRRGGAAEGQRASMEGMAPAAHVLRGLAYPGAHLRMVAVPELRGHRDRVRGDTSGHEREEVARHHSHDTK